MKKYTIHLEWKVCKFIGCGEKFEFTLGNTPEWIVQTGAKTKTNLNFFLMDYFGAIINLSFIGELSCYTLCEQ